MSDPSDQVAERGRNDHSAMSERIEAYLLNRTFDGRRLHETYARELASHISTIVIDGRRDDIPDCAVDEVTIDNGEESRTLPVPNDSDRHSAHVITKRRRGGGRSGVVHYMVGPTRETLEDAEGDLERYLGTEERECKWAIALQSLTPGGSEFQSPEVCVDYLRDRQRQQDGRLKNGIRERRSLAGQVADLRRALEEIFYLPPWALASGWSHERVTQVMSQKAAAALALAARCREAAS